MSEQNKKKFRSLFPEEVDCRVAKVSDKGASLVVYKDARVDMNLLDEYFPNNWEDEYQRKGDSLSCRLTLYTENGPRTYEDVGVESNAEAIKGEFSDAFKRASTKAGIGRGLYTAPFIWIGASILGVPEDKETVKDAISKARPYVSDIVFEEDRSGEFISYLEITASSGQLKGRPLFSWSPHNRKGIAVMTEELQTLKGMIAQLSGCTEEYVCKKMKVKTLKDIADSKKLYPICVENLQQQIDKRAAKRAAELEEINKNRADSPATQTEAAPKTPSTVKDDTVVVPSDETKPVDPLDIFTGNGNVETPTSSDDIPFTADEPNTTRPEDVIFDCTDDVPEDILALRGTRVGDLGDDYIKAFARKNAKIRCCIYENVLAAIEAVKEAS